MLKIDNGFVSELHRQTVSFIRQKDLGDQINHQNSFDSEYPCLGRQKQNLKFCSVSGMKEQIKDADDRATTFVKCDLYDLILKKKQVQDDNIAL